MKERKKECERNEGNYKAKKTGGAKEKDSTQWSAT